MTGFGFETKCHNQFLNSSGQIVDYDVCSESDLETAKNFYGESYRYVESGFITYHNGVKNVWPKKHHFFVKIHKAKIISL